MLGRLYGIKMFGRLYGIFKAAKTHKAFKRPSALSLNTRLCHTWYYFNTILERYFNTILVRYFNTIFNTISTQYLILFQHKTWYYFKAILERSFNAIPGTISTQCTMCLMYSFFIKTNLLLHNTMLHALLLVSPIHPYNTEQYPVTHDDGGDLGAHFVEDW